VLERAVSLRREAAFLVQLRRLSPRVAGFQWHARHVARRAGDEFSLVSATRPDKLAALLKLARGRRHVVELGTATAWTAISLLLADPQRIVTSYDPVQRAERSLYLALVDASVVDRLTFVQAPGAAGPRSGQPVDFLYIDSSHGREDTISELEAWRGVLHRGALVVFDDFSHPDYSGVREAVEELRLDGEECRGLFLHRITA
jgi:predicted O-methyltransferase YrrM